MLSILQQIVSADEGVLVDVYLGPILATLLEHFLNPHMEWRILFFTQDHKIIRWVEERHFRSHNGFLVPDVVYQATIVALRRLFHQQRFLFSSKQLVYAS